jgi:hypothetical protein
MNGWSRVDVRGGMHVSSLALITVLGMASTCARDPGDAGTGGAPGAGGTARTGGAPGAGGTARTGGAPGAGGTSGTGGTVGGPAIQGFGFQLVTGDFWRFGWDFQKQSSAWCGGTPASSKSSDSGSFQVVLGSAQTIAGTSAYAIEISGKSQNSDGSVSFTPRWKYLAVANNKLLGSTDGSTLETIFDANTGQWPGGGFFVAFPAKTLVVAKAGSIQNAYISDANAWVVSQSTSTSQCTYYSGVGTVCGTNWSTNTQQSEYYAAGTGPVGYLYRNSGGNDDGTCISSYQSSQNIGLIASSFTVKGGNGTGGVVGSGGGP